MKAKRFRVLLGTVLSSLLFISLASSVSANNQTDSNGSIETSKSSISDAKKKRAEQVNQFLSDFNGKKIRIAALQRQLNNTETLSETDTVNKSNELKKLEKEVQYTEDHFEELSGLVKVDPSDYGIQLMSTDSTDGTVSFSGTMYYDALFKHSYVISAGFNWYDREYFNQKSGTGNVGGYEGFTIGLNRQILTVSTSAAVYDQINGQIQSGVYFYQNYSNYGRAWRWQDTFKPYLSSRDYNSDSGIFALYFDFVTEPTTGAKTQYYATMAHTWDTTSVNSIGVGPYSASVGWANEGSQWTDSDQWIYTS